MEKAEQEESLVKRMRLATREIHNISDTLVNLKVAYGKKYDSEILIIMLFFNKLY